jgi:hypothetical protein
MKRQWSDEQVREMRAAYRDGASLSDIIGRFGGSQTAVHHAIIGATYATVPGWLTPGERADRNRRFGVVFMPAPLVNRGGWSS